MRRRSRRGQRNLITKWNRNTDRARERRQARVLGAGDTDEQAVKPPKTEAEFIRELARLRQTLPRIPDYMVKARTPFYDRITRYQRALEKIQARVARSPKAGQ